MTYRLRVLLYSLAAVGGGAAVGALIGAVLASKVAGVALAMIAGFLAGPIVLALADQHDWDARVRKFDRDVSGLFKKDAQ